MRRVGDIALLILQWALVVIGFGGLLYGVYLYLIVPDGVYSMPAPVPGEHIFRLDMRFTVLLQGLVSSLIAMGLGALLFYLRRLYLSRRQ